MKVYVSLKNLSVDEKTINSWFLSLSDRVKFYTEKFDGGFYEEVFESEDFSFASHNSDLMYDLEILTDSKDSTGKSKKTFLLPVNSSSVIKEMAEISNIIFGKNNTFLLIVDGNSIASTLYYATLPKKYDVSQAIPVDQNGNPCNMYPSFISAIKRIISKFSPSHLVVVWDGENKNGWRKKLNSDYKAHRGEKEKSLTKQIDICRMTLKEIGIPQIRLHDQEGDDVVGTIAKLFEKKIPCRIYSKDKDFLQLVTENTNLWLHVGSEDLRRKMWDKANVLPTKLSIPKSVVRIGPAECKSIYGFSPSQAVFYKSLVGDKSDNIHGIDGIGDHSAIEIINAYSKLSDFLDDAEYLLSVDFKGFGDTIKQLGLTKNMFTKAAGKKSDALMAEKLSTILTNVNFGKTPSLEALRVNNE